MAAPGEVTFEAELSAKRRVIRKDGVDCHNEEMLSIVVEKASGSSSSTSSCDELWYRMNAAIVDGTKTKRRMIHKVPKVFRQKESSKGCFDPSIVSIGPYHHGKNELQEVERLKDRMALQFIEVCKRPFSAVYCEVEQISGAAREYYPEESLSKFDEKGFTGLMFVDGCFVLQFIDSFLNKDEVEHMKSNIAAFVRRDLMLLENQLPYIVLQKLMSFRFEGNDGEDLIHNFIRSNRGVCYPRPSCLRATAGLFVKWYSQILNLLGTSKQRTATQTDQPEPGQEPQNNYQPLHLLDIFLTTYINTKDLLRQSFKSRHWYSYPAANELMTLGVHFRPSAGSFFTNIAFISTRAAGLLILPQIIVDNTTKSMLLNLVAYEASPDSPDDLCGVTSYICFMDSLIDQAEDVKALRSKGIVFNLLGSDHQAAQLFNGIAEDLVPNPYAFVVTKHLIEEYSRGRGRIKTWIPELINTHFRSPWTVIAFVAAAATIFLTFLATYVSLKDHCSGEGRQKDASFCAFF